MGPYFRFESPPPAWLFPSSLLSVSPSFSFFDDPLAAEDLLSSFSQDSTVARWLNSFFVPQISSGSFPTSRCCASPCSLLEGSGKTTSRERIFCDMKGLKIGRRTRRIMNGRITQMRWTRRGTFLEMAPSMVFGILKSRLLKPAPPRSKRRVSC